MEKTRGKQPELPFELIESILVEVSNQKDDDLRMATLRACALLSRDFAPLCQKIIFMSITLHPAGYDPRRTKDSLRRATGTIDAFGKLIASNPHLADHVQDLALLVVRADQKVPEDGIKALRMLCGLTHLTLRIICWDEVPGLEVEDEYDFAFESFWMHHNQTPLAKAVLSLIQGPQIRSLSFTNVCIFSNTLLRCPKLRSLDFRCAGVYTTTPPHFSSEERDLIDTECKPLSPPALETLRIDKASVHHFALRNHTFLNLGSLKTLSTPVDPVDGPGRSGINLLHSTLLPMAKQLTTLHMDEALSVSISDTIRSSTSTPRLPLRHLNPLSYTTLTRLKLIMRQKIRGRDSDWFPDPYHGLLRDTAFTQLENLEVLAIASVFNVPDFVVRGLENCSLGSHWGVLDTTVCPRAPQSSPFPNLAKVSLHFVVHDFILYAQALSVVAKIHAEIFQTQFPRLRGMEAVGKMELDLSTMLLDTWKIGSLPPNLGLDKSVVTT